MVIIKVIIRFSYLLTFNEVFGTTYSYLVPNLSFFMSLFIAAVFDSYFVAHQKTILVVEHKNRDTKKEIETISYIFTSFITNDF